MGHSAPLAVTAGENAAHAFRRRISAAAPVLLDALVRAAPDRAARAVRARGKARRTPLEWLPKDDPKYAECEELLAHKVARCLELLLEHHADGAKHVVPGVRRDRVRFRFNASRRRPDARGLERGALFFRFLRVSIIYIVLSVLFLLVDLLLYSLPISYA